MSINHLPNYEECFSASGKFRAIPNINKKPGKCKIFSKEEIEKYQQKANRKQQEYNKLEAVG
jgi:hypothetical protein